MTKDKLRIASIIFLIVFLVSLLYLFVIRKNADIDLMPYLKINEESTYKDYISYDGTAIHYRNFVYDGDDFAHFNDDEKNAGKGAVTAVVPNLKWGGYQVRIHYSADYGTSEVNEPNTRLTFQGGRQDSYQYTAQELWNYKSYNNSLLWIRDINGTTANYGYGDKPELEFNIDICGYGSAIIDSIQIVEYTPWKIGFLIFEILVYACIIFFIKVYCRWNIDRKIAFWGTILLVVISSVPTFCKDSGHYKGHDLSFHINRIASIASELARGKFPVIYQPDAHYGAGYISNIMYGKLFLYIPAVMHLLGIPLSKAYNMYIIMINTLTVLVSYYSFNSVFKERKYAYVGTVLYTLSAYRITNLYVRSAVGEYTAMTFLPLFMCGMYRIYFNDEKIRLKDIIVLVIATTGLIQSHVLTTELLIPFVLVFAVIHWKKTIKKILNLAIALIVIIIGNIGYIIPFLDQYSYGLTVNSSELSSNILKEAVYLGQIFSLFMVPDGRSIDYSTKGDLPLTIGAPLVIGFLLCVLLIIINKSVKYKECEIEGKHLSTEIFIYAIAAMFLTTVYFPWNIIAGKHTKIFILFTSLQFPWRYLGLATLFLTFTTVSALQTMDKHEEIKVFTGINYNLTTGIILFLNILVVSSFFTGYIHSKNIFSTGSINGNVSQDGLYLPNGTDGNLLEHNRVFTQKGELFAIKGYGTYEDGTRYFEFSDIESDTEISLPIICYDFLSVRDDGTGGYFDIKPGYNNYITLTLPAGYEGRIIVEYGLKPLWKAAYIFAGICWICVFAGVILEKRRPLARKTV